MIVVCRYYARSQPFMPWRQIEPAVYHRLQWSFTPLPDGMTLCRRYEPAETVVVGEVLYEVDDDYGNLPSRDEHVGQ
jgi:hypothetical protein